MRLLSSLKRQVFHEIQTVRGAIYKRLAGRQAFAPDVVDAFHQAYYDARAYNQTWRNTWWMGHAVLKCPLDLWLYQEIIHKLRPAVVVETGTAFGGSALYMASLFDLVGQGRVITVDLEPRDGRPAHPRITYVTGSSVAADTVARVRDLVGGEGPVMVILDSDHSEAHVRQELELYHPFVPVGSYLIVEDTNVNGHPVERHHGPGPWEATHDFLGSHPEFEHDTAMDKFLLTFNPKGYLKRLR